MTTEKNLAFRNYIHLSHYRLINVTQQGTELKNNSFQNEKGQ